jgi:hypothetical protein
MDMHNMIISHLICEVNGKAMPKLSKQNTQTDYVANKYMLCGYCWLQSVKVFNFNIFHPMFCWCRSVVWQ